MKTRGQELAEQFVDVASNRDDLAARIDAAIKDAVGVAYEEVRLARERDDL